MNENITSRENCSEVIAWLRGADAIPDPVMEDRFLEVLASMVIQRMHDDEERRRQQVAQARKARREELAKNHPLSLRHIVDEMRKEGEIDCTYEELMGITPRNDPGPEPEVPVETENNREESRSEIDSFTLGRIIRYMGMAEAHPLNMSQIQIILYISYGVWLASTGERLTSEHPQVWQFGPVFPRAYNKLRKDSESGQEEYESMKKSNPAIVEFLNSQFHRFGWMTASAASGPHVAAGTPWARTKKRNPDKWGVALEDSEVAEWFAARM